MEKYECWEEYNKYGCRTHYSDCKGLLMIDEYEEKAWTKRKYYYFASSTKELVTYEQSKKIELYELTGEETNPKAVSLSKRNPLWMGR